MSLVMGEYTSNCFLMPGQLLAPPILFSILCGALVDSAASNSYSLPLVIDATFSICNNQSAKSRLLPPYSDISHIRLSY